MKKLLLSIVLLVAATTTSLHGWTCNCQNGNSYNLQLVNQSNNSEVCCQLCETC